MDKKVLSERDICTKYITPAIKKAGWDLNIQYEVEIDLGDPEELMIEYQEIVKQLETAQAALKQELMDALGDGK